MGIFSERHGYTSPPAPLDERLITPKLRAGLWDVVCAIIIKGTEYEYVDPLSGHFDNVSYDIWFNFYREPTDERPWGARDTLDIIRKRFFGYNFTSLYDFLEFLAYISNDCQRYTDLCNTVLEREKAAFRFVDKILIKIIDEVERDEMQMALNNTKSSAVRRHISQALTLYGDREHPDFRNSVKESISAVEAAARFVTGANNATLGKALAEIEKIHPIHKSLRSGFSSIYGYSSDSGGIRHAMSDGEKDITEADARFMLVSCSAFANYLISLKAN